MMQYPLRELKAAGVEVLDCVHKTPEAVENGHPYIAIPDINDGRVVLETARLISDEDLISWNRRAAPEPGDIIVTRRGRVGDTAVVPNGVRCAIGQNLVLLRSDGIRVNQDYLRWATTGPFWSSEVDRLRNVGAVFSSLNVRDIPRLRIPLPVWTQQRAIAEVLGALDDKIAVNTKLAQSADELAHVLVHSSVDQSDRRRLDAVATITMGSSPAGATMNGQGEGAVFYQGVRDFGLRYPVPRVWSTAPTRWAQAGDVLLSVRAPVGQVNVAPDRLCIGRGLAAVRHKQDHQATLFHLLRQNSDVWAPHEAEGTVFGSINRAQLHGVMVPRVADGAGAQLEHHVARIEESITVALRENHTLKETRDTLLPQLMSGKLRVNDAEAIVSEAT